MNKKLIKQYKTYGIKYNYSIKNKILILIKMILIHGNLMDFIKNLDLSIINR